MLYNRRNIFLRSPLRVSFIGGGTDLETYYSQGKPGHVVSAAINLFCYVNLKDMFDSNIRVHHSEIETEPIASRIKHTYARTALEYFGLFRGVEVVISSDVMATGSGLGASSSIMGALIVGCNEFRGNPSIPKKELAELIYQLEYHANTITGKQDQYAVAFGGLNSIHFSNDGVTVNPINISKSKIEELENRCLLIFTNLARESRTIQLNLKNNATQKDRQSYFDQLVELSYEFLNELQSKNTDFNQLGKILHEAWMLKKKTNPMSSNVYIDQLYSDLKKKGVIGGKLLGAGGGGFFLAFTKNQKVRDKIKYSLYPNFIALDLKIHPNGTEILWKNF